MKTIVGILVLGTAAALGWRYFAKPPPREDVVVVVGGQPITQSELEVAVRAQLFKEGLSEAAAFESADQQRIRETALAGLVDARLVRHHRLVSGITSDVEAATEEERRGWWRLFDNDDERARRLEWQHLDETALTRQMREAQMDQAWVEQEVRKLAPPVTEGDVRAWYDAHQEMLRQPVIHRVSHLFLTRHNKAKPDRQAEIQAIYRQLSTAPGQFAMLTARHSEDARTRNHGGDLGWVSARRMPADFMAAVESLKVGEMSAPVQTKLGWHILRVAERRPARLPAFEEVRGEIEAMLVSQRRQEGMRILIRDWREPVGHPPSN